MNRIILIGNGFDLAHGLPTRYEDFINWYWEKRVYSFHGNFTAISEDCLCSIKIISSNEYKNWSVFASHIMGSFDRRSGGIIKPSGKDVIKDIKNDIERYEFKLSPFFKSICESIETKGWVDIEREYYNQYKGNHFPDTGICHVKTPPLQAPGNPWFGMDCQIPASLPPHRMPASMSKPGCTAAKRIKFSPAFFKRRQGLGAAPQAACRSGRNPLLKIPQRGFLTTLTYALAHQPQSSPAHCARFVQSPYITQAVHPAAPVPHH